MGKAKHPHNPDRPEPKGVITAIENGDLDALLRVLSVRQKRFCEEYAFDYDGKAAAIRAGYAIPYADRQAHLLLRHRGVMFYIDHLTKNQQTNATLIDVDYILQGIIRVLGKAEDKENLTAALRALELLARHKGMLTDKQEITGKDGGPLEIENRRKVEEAADAFTNLIKEVGDKRKKPDLKVVGGKG